MNSKEIIESGLLELYCMGATSREENEMIESMMKADNNLKNQFQLIQSSIEQYADANAKQPPAGLLRNIFDSIAQAESEQMKLPPLLSRNTIANDWRNYLSKNKISKPGNNEALNMIEFAQTSSMVTYIAWAKNGASIEESHDDQIERLFMLKGSCKIEFLGVVHYFSEGDFVEIPAGTLHRAEATSDEMILIGQRLAA